MPHGQVEHVGRTLNVARLSDRNWLCQALVNIVKYLTLAVTRAPELTQRVEFYQPMKRSHAARTTLMAMRQLRRSATLTHFTLSLETALRLLRTPS
ncbi:hypothetical protein WJX82_010384 [Trebouxia sp. C0006]